MQTIACADTGPLQLQFETSRANLRAWHLVRRKASVRTEPSKSSEASGFLEVGELVKVVETFQIDDVERVRFERQNSAAGGWTSLVASNGPTTPSPNAAVVFSV